ncbi:MAG: TasA family protein [Thermoanaerobacteraceae bacterium]|nr:TasA family protein [Thermoanaerobacteraceae bacterium]
MRKILIALLGVLLVAALAGAGTFAYFSDTETSTGNTFAAGTIDLTLNQSAPAPINLTNMKPGDDVSATITVQNVGSLAGKLYADASYTEQDNTNTTEFTTNMTADQTAKMLLITAFTADSIDILSQIPDVDTDSRKTVYDLVNDPSGIDLTPA